MSDDDFYEEDEPIEDILAIVARSPSGVTAPPNRPWLRVSAGMSNRVVLSNLRIVSDR